MEIKIDRTTLPDDNQRVRFKNYNDDWWEGVYIEEENMFWVNESIFYSAWLVHEWELVNTKNKKL